MYGVNVGKSEAIVGFRYPTEREPDKGDNTVRDGELRVATSLMAVLGMPSPMQYKWPNYESASFVASVLPNAKVVLVVALEGIENMAKEKEKKSGGKVQKAAGRKPVGRKASQKSTGGRKCSECGQKGHNMRSHAPGGRLAK